MKRDNHQTDEDSKQTWAKNPSIRSEFGDDFDSYLAYEKANENGQIKMLGGRNV